MRRVALSLLLLALLSSFVGCALEDMFGGFMPKSSPSSSDVDYYRRIGREP